MSPLRNATVLIADDEPGVLEALAEYLERLGSHVVKKADGVEALSALREDAIDLAVVDASMPRLSGLEVVRWLRFVCGRATLPVLLITGRTDPAILEATRRVGAHAVLRKPFSLSDFRHVVERLIVDPDQLPAELDAAYALDTDEGPGTLDSLARNALQALARAVDRQDPHGPYHSLRVAELARVLALHMGLDRRRRAAIHTAGLLHDVGKLLFPPDVLSGRAPLDGGVRELICRHPSTAADLLTGGPVADDTTHGVLHHHERWDGGGYPDGLSADTIPLPARVVAVAEAYAAMTSETPFHSAKAPLQGLGAVLDQAGGQFDPQVAEVLAEVVEADAD